MRYLLLLLCLYLATPTLAQTVTDTLVEQVGTGIHWPARIERNARGETVRVTYFYPNGRPQSVQRYHSGELEHAVVYDSVGTVEHEWDRQQGLITGHVRPLTGYEENALVQRQGLIVAAVGLGLLLALLWRRRGYESTYVYLFGGFALLLLISLMADAAARPGVLPKELMLRVGAVLTVLDAFLFVLSVRNLVVKSNLPLIVSAAGLLISILLGCWFAVASTGGMLG